MSDFAPKIIVFCCSWCSHDGAALAGASRLIRTMCSGRVEPTFILYAFSRGADGVMVVGCPPGDCHYTSGNYKTRRRVMLLKNTLPQLGIEPERLRLEWISAAEGTKFPSALKAFTNEIARLGPLH